MIPEGVDPALYFITDTALCGGPERVPHVVYEAVAGGAGIVQVRDKHADDAAFLALARACRDAVRRAEDALGRTAALVVNDRVGVAERLGLHVHVGQSDASLADANVVSVNRGAPIRGTVMHDFSDRTYQQTITGYVYYVNVR